MNSEAIPLYQPSPALPSAEGPANGRDIQGNRSEIEQPSAYAPGLTERADDDDDDDYDDNWKASQVQRKGKSIRKEKRKVILGRSGTRAFQHFVFFHAIPIAGALGLIVLNTMTKFYTGDPARIPLLQFIAKIHESLVLISIAIIMVAYLQYLLIHERAVPFGSIFFAHQMTHMGYLVSPEFRAAITTPEFPLPMKVVFATIIIFSVLLASVVGPSIAIATQPRMTNYTLPDWSGYGINASRDYLYPTVLKNDTELPSDWENLEGLVIPPVSTTFGIGGTSEFGVQPRTIEKNGRGMQVKGMPVLYTSTIRERQSYSTSLLGYALDRTMYVQYAPNATIATVAQVFAASSIRRAFSLFPGQPYRVVSPTVISADIPQAYVSTVCELNTIMGMSDMRPIRFPDSYFVGYPNFIEDDELRTGLNTPNAKVHTTISRKHIWEENTKAQTGRIIWIDGGVEISSPVAGTTPAAIVVHPEPCRSLNGTTFLSVSACVVGARWVNTTMRLTRTTYYDKGNVENDLSPDSLINTPDWKSRDSVSSSLIDLTAEWANASVGATRVFNLTENTDDRYPSIKPIRIENAVHNLLQSLPLTDIICPLNGTYTYKYRPLMHEAVLSTLVANAISHHHSIVDPFYHYGGEWRYIGQEYGKGLTELLGMTFTFRYVITGYAWTMHGTSIKVAIPILCLYCICALSYVIYSLISKRSSLAWSSISGLVALAMNSTPSRRLKNTGAGVGTTSIFKNLVKVKECGSSRKIELVFEKDIEEDKSRGVIHRGIMAGRAYA